MDKNALRELLAQRVQEKVETGYEVRLYAADVGEPERIKRALTASPTLVKPGRDEDPYKAYLESVKNGTYEPIKEDEFQEGYRAPDRKRQAKGELTVHSRSTGRTATLGAPVRKPGEADRSKSIRLDDLSLFG
ncbi:hypothetical protein IFT48_00935 [Pseudomonas fluorescens]|uniref:hypothetical protein n=1 Tax=Pseudomonas fluorescens TaxID=294 RepID=UPI00193094FD|nr:hypothetical protein [Pseudomonas fluorescens]MBD8088557.1 hypothetical protein [Pseudomonas fluorescens]